MEVKNILSEVPKSLENECFESLIQTREVKIERIISLGHASPEGYWYDQQQNEWVLVIKGRARLRFEGSDTMISLEAGDYINIPSHRRHRVEWTDPAEETIWLAVHY
ncbi:pyrimidine/purine nucleoside phosphorylase [Desulforhabdus amnigena]|jgi:cupin 2 domain-containing protein|uniref:Cupin n=1 Tax=Desulforhabdus amnigena TaxID=40218 RepID=A0A9W6D152_9BACT|nr:pyrimidine/purine nucleoside phosphorylase [Desulforhabdus amnigena]GLI33373.1 cupin [Desulforhabdus amnigena]